MLATLPPFFHKAMKDVCVVVTPSVNGFTLHIHCMHSKRCCCACVNRIADICGVRRCFVVCNVFFHKAHAGAVGNAVFLFNMVTNGHVNIIHVSVSDKFAFSAEVLDESFFDHLVFYFGSSVVASSEGTPKNTIFPPKAALISGSVSARAAPITPVI